MVLSDKERKAKKKEYQSRPEIKAKRKKYQSTPERKAKKKEYRSRPEIKAKEKEYKKKYESRPEVKAKRKKYQTTLENKAKAKVRTSRPEYRKKRNKVIDNLRLKVLQYYSKHLSKSDIPCCRCCGEKFHIGFLAIDHITGKKEMDSEPELVKLGYSSLLESTPLLRWLTKNNFPKGFQILCHNCNSAKAVYGKCPHQLDKMK